MDNINKSFLGSRTELLFFMKNNRNSFWEMMSQNPDLRQDVSRLLEKEILHQGQINYSSIVEMSSNLDPKQTFHPIKNTLVISSENGLAFSTMAEEYLKEKIKNPFFKLDDTFIKDFLRKRREKIDEEEELIVRKNVIRKNEELKEEEDTYALTDVKKFMQAIYHDILKETPERRREKIRQIKELFIESKAEFVNFTRDLMQNEDRLLALGKLGLYDSIGEPLKHYKEVVYKEFNQILKEDGIREPKSTEIAKSITGLMLAPAQATLEIMQKGKFTEYLNYLKENNPEYVDALKAKGIDINNPEQFMKELSNPKKLLEVEMELYKRLKEKNINPIDYYEQRLKYLLDNGYINTEKMAILRKEAEKVFKDLKDSSDDARNNNVSSKNIVNNENSDNINIKDTAIKSDLLDNFKISFNKDIYNKNYHQNEINLTNETLEDESNRNLKNKGL